MLKINLPKNEPSDEERIPKWKNSSNEIGSILEIRKQEINQRVYI